MGVTGWVDTEFQLIDKEIIKSYMHVYVCEKLNKILNFHTLKYNKIKIIIVGIKFKWNVDNLK